MFGCFFFFFQAEDGIRDIGVTGVQTCALPISSAGRAPRDAPSARCPLDGHRAPPSGWGPSTSLAHAPISSPTSLDRCSAGSRYEITGRATHGVRPPDRKSVV